MTKNFSTSRQKPRKSSLIANLLNRVDGLSLAIKKMPNGGVAYYFESEKTKHIKANKDSLQFLNYEELEQLINLNNLVRDSFTMDMFHNLEQHIPVKVPLEQKPKTFIVRKNDDNNTKDKKDYSKDVNNKNFRKSNNKDAISFDVMELQKSKKEAPSQNKKPNNQNNKRKRI